MNAISQRVASEIGQQATALVRSGRASSVEQAVRMAMDRYCSGGVAGLDGLVSTQTEFNRLNAAQNHAIAIQAQISGIGKDAWDTAIDGYGAAIESAGWIPASDYSYDKMMAFWLAQTKRLLVYGSAWLEHRPTTEDVDDVERLASGTDNLIALLRNYLPNEAMTAGQVGRAQAQAALASTKMTSPDDVSQATLKEEVLKNVNTLASGTSTVLWAAAILAAALAFGGRR